MSMFHLASCLGWKLWTLLCVWVQHPNKCPIVWTLLQWEILLFEGGSGDFFYACIGGRFFDGLGFVSSIHPVSECIAKCRGLSHMYSILTYVPNKKDVASTCCLGCSCADFETLEEIPVLEPSSYCNTNFTEGTSGVCWSSCYDSVYCSFGEKLANGDCPIVQ